jgi:TPR repeat protein
MTSGWRRLVSAAALVLVVVAAIASAAAARLPRPSGWGTAAIAGVALAAGLLLDPFKRLAGEWIEQPRGQRKALEAHLRMRDRRGRPRRVRDCRDAVALGVHPATAGAAGLPPYVRRDVHESLGVAFTAGGLVIIEGRSAAGKSRLAYEAIHSFASDWWLIVPETPQALKELRKAGVSLRRAVVWLDDVERYLAGDGLDGGVLDALCHRDTVLLATLRSEARRDLIGSEPGSALRRAAEEVLQRARTIHLSRDLSADERPRAERHRDDARIAAALDHPSHVGFAEYLAAGPATLDRWRSARNGEHPIAGAIISAAVDVRRAGFVAPVPQALLEVLYEQYLETRDRAGRHRLPSFDEALMWAAEPVRGASGCLNPVSEARYDPFDYLTDHAQNTGSIRDIPDAVWDAALAHVTAEDLTAVAYAAFQAGRLSVSEAAYRRAAEAGNAGAMNNLGVLLNDKGRVEEATEWFRRAASAGEAAAMVNFGNQLRSDGLIEEAESWYRRAVEAGHPTAMHNLAIVAEMTDRINEAETWWRRAADAGHVYAMNSLAFVLRRTKRADEAEAWWRRAADTGHTGAMRNLGNLLYETGRTSEAEMWWTRAARTESTPAGNLGDFLRQRGLAEEAEVQYRRAADAGDVTAMRSLGHLLKETGRVQEGERWLRRADPAG